MAVLSTAISLLNAVSSNLDQDFDFGRGKGEQSVQLSRKITAGIGLAAVVGSFYAGAIVALLIQSYELSVYCLFIPVCAALLKQEATSLSAWFAFAFGGAAFCLTRDYSYIIPKEILCLPGIRNRLYCCRSLDQVENLQVLYVMSTKLSSSGDARLDDFS